MMMNKKNKATSTPGSIRDRIKEHVSVRAGDLVPHELNPRTHDDTQREALTALYGEIGFARSLLGYRLPDGRIKLIDGHLRQSMDPEMKVWVEVLDVTDDEAKKLLLSLDPLAALAGYNHDILDVLQSQVQSESDHLTNLWQATSRAKAAAEAVIEEVQEKGSKKRPAQEIEERFCVMIECTDERHQVDILRWCKQEGLSCKALTT